LPSILLPPKTPSPVPLSHFSPSNSQKTVAGVYTPVTGVNTLVTGVMTTETSVNTPGTGVTTPITGVNAPVSGVHAPAGVSALPESQHSGILSDACTIEA